MTREVADEWAKAGKLTVPPDTDTMDEHTFWDEVQRRYNEACSDQGDQDTSRG